MKQPFSEEIGLGEAEIRELEMLASIHETNCESEVVKNSECYKKLMEISNFRFCLDFHNLPAMELLAKMISIAPKLSTLNLIQLSIFGRYKVIIENLMNSEVLDILYIKFNNIDVSALLAAKSLVKSKSLISLYVLFDYKFYTGSITVEIIKTLIKIPTLEYLNFINYCEASDDLRNLKTIVEGYVEEVKQEIYLSFTALRYGDQHLPLELAGAITAHHPNLNILNLEIDYR